MEIWKDVVGFEGLYKVSNYGNIKSLDRRVNVAQGRTRIMKGKMLNPYNTQRKIPDNAVTWVDFEHLRDKIIRLSCRYSIARERGCVGQVEWSDRLIKQDDVLKAFEEYQKGGK